jgi:hypothetical protein
VTLRTPFVFVEPVVEAVLLSKVFLACAAIGTVVKNKARPKVDSRRVAFEDERLKVEGVEVGKTRFMMRFQLMWIGAWGQERCGLHCTWQGKFATAL